ncbi:MAG: hypothetical protein EOP85_03180 [Verrucomicrobiaceae bacterium]|nr:MAG: hypothetical protein EOP85_03180 [Verrucomicrobiaceae bacterium]
MNRHLPKIAAALLVIACLLIIKMNREPVVVDPFANMPASGRAASPPPDSIRGDDRRIRAKPRRFSLEESLGAGATVVRPATEDGGLVVTYPGGSSISAAGAAATDRGVNFHGPYQMKGADGSVMMSTGGDSRMSISRDGKSFKATGGMIVLSESRVNPPFTLKAESLKVIDARKEPVK